jgi:tetratricopeptide (TPR) repeat protein
LGYFYEIIILQYNKSHIGAYVGGKMSKEDRIVFEATLLVDEDLRVMVDGYKLLERKKGNVDKWLEQEKSKFDKQLVYNTKHWAKYATAAGLAICLIGFGYQYYQSNQKLPIDFEEAGLPVFMSPETDAMNEVMNAYKTNDIVLAKLMLEDLIVNFGKNDTTQYFEGVFLKEQKKYEEALEYFKPEMISQITLKQKAEMQRAICLAYLGKDEEANIILNKIKEDSSHLFYKRITELVF